MKSILFVAFSICLITLSSCKDKNSTKKETTVLNESIGDAKEHILFVVSNAHFYGASKLNTANHFSEIVLAYDEFIKEGYIVDFVSPEGGAVPLGYLQTSDPIIKKYLYECEFMTLLSSTKKPSNVVSSSYQAIYFVGGGAAMFGVPENEEIQKIAQEIYAQEHGIVSAICHGTAGLVNIKTKNGTYLVAHKQVNGFPDIFENKEAKYYQEFPFSIEQKIIERGGDFQYSKDGWDNYSVQDGKLITGQDPTSAVSVAQKIIAQLRSKKVLTK